METPGFLRLKVDLDSLPESSVDPCAEDKMAPTPGILDPSNRWSCPVSHFETQSTSWYSLQSPSRVMQMVREFQRLSENALRAPAPLKPPRPNRQVSTMALEMQALEVLDKSIDEGVTLLTAKTVDVSVNTDFMEDTNSESQESIDSQLGLDRESFQDPVATECKDPSALSTQRPSNAKHFVVVAIDFGTTFSGYAFSFVANPQDVHVMRKWEGGDAGSDNRKTPTILLLKPTGEFHSFGFTARDAYHNLEGPDAQRWLYFDKFKMALHRQQNLSRDTDVTAANGVSVPALTVFAHSLRFFKDHALEELSDQSATRIYSEDIRWVVTVPAIWRPSAKQFMRQAAYEAGIGSPQHPDRLLIALEPEAASIHCRGLQVNQLSVEGPQGQRPLSDERAEPAVGKLAKGTKYMIVDCGGGTVDITVHEMADEKGTLKELHRASGGPHGSIGVDMEFDKLMSAVFGFDLMEEFRLTRSAGYVELTMAFEYRKRTASPYNPTLSNVTLPFSFITFHKKRRKYGVDVAIKRFGREEIRWSSQGMLRLDPGMMRILFQPTLDNITGHIREVLDRVRAHGAIDYLFLVGGFAESPILQQRIRNEFSKDLKVVIPQGVALAIVKGAVQYGLNPGVINIRRSRATYGIGILHRYVLGEHPADKLIATDDGIEYCADIFDRFVHVDQSVGIGDTALRRYTPARAGQSSITMHVYSSESETNRFVTDPGVLRCGTLYLDLDTAECPEETPREIHVKMVFGDTEVKVQAVDLVSGKNVRAVIDFLGQ